MPPMNWSKKLDESSGFQTRRIWKPGLLLQMGTLWSDSNGHLGQAFLRHVPMTLPVEYISLELVGGREGPQSRQKPHVT